MGEAEKRKRKRKVEAAVEEDDGERKSASEVGRLGAAGSSDGVFASCSFADLGLHPTLCQHLKGPALRSPSPLLSPPDRTSLGGLHRLEC